ncbi:hypothetical protein H0H81_003090 [Sphagnurus paluster]|uniref:Transposase n=1 Tax=Sphagnurus paluster TaxID=117069 RepID=A0A9P7K1F6_9AGAR|nr:hypothetical protein H0H81_003090 [Sphagnurus paluster]
MLDEDFEHELAEIVEELTAEDFELLRAFTFKTEDHLMNKTFEKFKYAFPTANIQSWKSTKTCVEFLSALHLVPYNCCVNSCLCFTGAHAAAASCHFCNELRLDSAGKARKRFIYIPIIHCLIEYFRNTPLVNKMRYCALFSSDPMTIKDVFDGSHYSSLRKTNVKINGRVRPYKHFWDDRDIALGLSTDGFAPFKKWKATAWPLLIFNYNLPPEI